MQVLLLVVKFRLRYDLWFGVLASSVGTSLWAAAGISTLPDRTICFAGILYA